MTMAKYTLAGLLLLALMAFSVTVAAGHGENSYQKTLEDHFKYITNGVTPAHMKTVEKGGGPFGQKQEQFNLGMAFWHGWAGFEKDPREAVRWFRLAAEQEHGFSQLMLGIMYVKGDGVPQNYAEAANWWWLGASRGDTDCQINLARMYYEGKGVTQNYIEAHMWFNIAAAESVQDIAKIRDKLAKQMTLEQVAEAQRLAVEQLAVISERRDAIRARHIDRVRIWLKENKNKGDRKDLRKRIARAMRQVDE